MKSPFVRRSKHDEKVYELQQEIRNRDKALSKLGHRVKEIKVEHAKLLSDLRMIRVHIEYPRYHDDVVGFKFELAGSLFDSFRRDLNFVDVLAHMVEHMMMMEPEGRKLLAGMYDVTPKIPSSPLK